MRLALLLTAGLSAAALTGQNITSPPGMVHSHTGLHDPIPWGCFRSPEQLYQQVHDDLRGTSRQIQGMAFRHAWNANYVPRSYTATLTLGEAAASASNTSSTFANNWRSGGSQTVVLKGTIHFPALKAQAASPAPFDAPLGFTTPYAHAGLHPLIWQVHISQASANTPTHYFESGPSSAHMPGTLGTGCAMSGQTSPLTSSGGLSTTALAERLSNGPASGLALVAVGNIADEWSNTRLPVDLVFAGSPGCFLHINILMYLPPTTPWLFARPYKWGPKLSGKRIRTQWAVADKGFLRTSNGLDHSFPYTDNTTNRWPSSRVWATSFGSTTPATGTVDTNGLVVEFR